MGCIQLCWLDMQKINFYWSAVCGSSGGLHSECGLCKCLQLRWVWAGKSVCQFSVIDRDRIWCRHDSEGLSFIESTPEKWPHALQHWNSLSMLFLVRFPATPLGSKLFLHSSGLLWLGLMFIILILCWGALITCRGVWILGSDIEWDVCPVLVAGTEVGEKKHETRNVGYPHRNMIWLTPLL